MKFMGNIVRMVIMTNWSDDNINDTDYKNNNYDNINSNSNNDKNNFHDNDK